MLMRDEVLEERPVEAGCLFMGLGLVMSGACVALLLLLESIFS